MENVTDQKLIEVLSDPNKTRAFFSDKANLTTLINSEAQRARLASLITKSGLDLGSIAGILGSLSGGRISLVAPR